MIGTKNISTNAATQHQYPWTMWSGDECYAVAYCKFYKQINYGDYELVHDWVVQRGTGDLAVLYDNITGQTISNNGLYIYEYRQS